MITITEKCTTNEHVVHLRSLGDYHLRVDYLRQLEREEGQRQADRVRRMFDGRAMA